MNEKIPSNAGFTNTGCPKKNCAMLKMVIFLLISGKSSFFKGVVLRESLGTILQDLNVENCTEISNLWVYKGLILTG